MGWGFTSQVHLARMIASSGSMSQWLKGSMGWGYGGVSKQTRVTKQTTTHKRRRMPCMRHQKHTNIQFSRAWGQLPSPCIHAHTHTHTHVYVYV